MVKSLKPVLALGFSLLLVACDETPLSSKQQSKQQTPEEAVEDHARFSGQRPKKGNPPRAGRYHCGGSG